MNHRNPATRVTSTILFSCVAASLTIIAPTIFAGAASPDEIVITVRKTEENPQDVPVQVSLFGEQDIERERLRTLDDIADLTPSLQFDTGFWASDTRVSIRGLFNRTGRPSAAVLIDGIDAMSESLSSTGGSALLNQRILDIERIEVARGPQSALYGRGAFSGAINYVTRRPTHEWNASVTADVAEDNRKELRATFGGSVVEDKLAFRALVSGFDYDGPYTNPNTGGDVGGGESTGAGLAFEWTPTDDFTAYWNTTYSDDEFGPLPQVFVKANALRVVSNDGMGNTTLIPNGDFSDCDTPSSGPTGDACLLVVTGNIKADASMLDIPPDPRFATPTDYPGTDDETFRTNLILDWDINEDLAFRSATSYTDADQSLRTNTSAFTGRGPAIPGVPDLNAVNQDTGNMFSFEQVYQEFQLSGDMGDDVNWLVGLNGFWEDASIKDDTRFWFLNPIQCVFNAPNADCTFEDADIFDKTIKRDTTSTSIFGLIGWGINEKLKLTVEGRWIRDKVEVETDTSDTAGDALAGNFDYPESPGFSDEVSDNNFVPKVTLDYMLSEDALVYVSAAKGIKPPTYNTNDFRDADRARLLTEKLWTYEIGAKTQWDEGRVIVNGAVFFNDYEDKQERVQFPNPVVGGLPLSGALNAGAVEVWGAEIDASWAPTDNLFFSASYAYTNGEFTDFNLEQLQNPAGQMFGDPDFASVSISSQSKSGNKQGDFSGNDTPGNPEHALSLLGKYQRPLNGDLDWYVQGTASYQGERWADAANLVELEDYWLSTAQFGVEHENWNVAVYADNLFDDDTIQYAQEFIDFQVGFQLPTLSFPVAYFAYLPQPRTIGIKFQYQTP